MKNDELLIMERGACHPLTLPLELFGLPLAFKIRQELQGR
jgi:hypothetical protein